MSIKAFIFDLDGTLTNTLGGIAYSCNHILEKYNFPTHSIEDYKKYVGYGLYQTLLRALPNSFREEVRQKKPDTLTSMSSMHREMVDYYQTHPLVETKLYEGIDQVLDYLEENHIPWAIHTNKEEKTARHIAKHFFEKRSCLNVYGAIQGLPLKPNPTRTLELVKEIGESLGENLGPSDVAFIGDSEVDIETAGNAGCFAIGVTWGFRTKKDLLDLSYDMLVDRPKDILNCLH